MAIGRLVLLIVGLLLLAGIALTIGLVARGRPPQPTRTEAERTRFAPRSMRGFNRMMLRDVRRGASGSPRHVQPPRPASGRRRRRG